MLADLTWVGAPADGHGWSGPPGDVLADYELALNPWFLNGTLQSMCCYDPTRLPTRTWQRLCTAHPCTVGPDGVEPLCQLRLVRTSAPARGAPATFRLTGEADLSNRAALPGLLGAATAWSAAVTIDATGLTFADANAAWQIIRAAAARDGRPATVIAGTGLAKLLAVLGAGAVDGLRIEVRRPAA